MSLKFELDFRIKPYVRMTQRGKFVKPAALEYRANQDDIKTMLKNQMALSGMDMFPGQTRLRVIIVQVVKGAIHNHDGDNTVKALFDAMKGIVYPDDRWIDTFIFERKAGNIDKTRIDVGFEIFNA